MKEPKYIIRFPWTGNKGDWRDMVHNEIHLLVARVQGTDSLDEQIQHGNDFVERFKELIEEVIKQQYPTKPN